MMYMCGVQKKWGEWFEYFFFLRYERYGGGVAVKYLKCAHAYFANKKKKTRILLCRLRKLIFFFRVCDIYFVCYNKTR